MMNCWKCKQRCKNVKATCTLGHIVSAKRCPSCKRIFYSNEQLKAYESKTKTDKFPVVESVWQEEFIITRLNRLKQNNC